ncbi:unnamed protein product [Protopolystoma xenopodis]|uniref:Uncharacterized protein n=1 Tax=Protopolystoma xenopodis TaxID=117903 RepID=A0A448X0Y0_9PLAT|nr:unnamed protein product [Protopolystoma xenopodis]
MFIQPVHWFFVRRELVSVANGQDKSVCIIRVMAPFLPDSPRAAHVFKSFFCFCATSSWPNSSAFLPFYQPHLKRGFQPLFLGLKRLRAADQAEITATGYAVWTGGCSFRLPWQNFRIKNDNHTSPGLLRRSIMRRTKQKTLGYFVVDSALF